jgi:hypothetical protein
MVDSLSQRKKSDFDDLPLTSRATSIFIQFFQTNTLLQLDGASSVQSSLCFSLNELQIAFIARVK